MVAALVPLAARRSRIEDNPPRAKGALGPSSSLRDLSMRPKRKSPKPQLTVAQQQRKLVATAMLPFTGNTVGVGSKES